MFLSCARIADVILELVNRTPFQNRVVVIATALNGKALHPKLNHLESSHFFTCELNIPPLTSVSCEETSQHQTSIAIN